MDYFSVDSTTGRVSLKLPLDGFNITDEAAGNNEIPVRNLETVPLITQNGSLK